MWTATLFGPPDSPWDGGMFTVEMVFPPDFPDAPPATLQSKFSPYHRGRTGNAGNEDFYATSAELKVVITAYCPLNDWPSKLKAVDDTHIAAIAKRYGKTAAQVILRWHLQRGLTPIPKGSSKAHIVENYNVFDFELSARPRVWVIFHRPKKSCLIKN